MVAPIVTNGSKPSAPDFFVGIPEILDKVRKGGVVLKNDLNVEIADGEVNWLLVAGCRYNPGEAACSCGTTKTGKFSGNQRQYCWRDEQ